MKLRTILLGTGLAPVLAACSAVTPAALPEVLRVDAGAALVLSTSARGVQIYECRDGRWTFVAPQAELFDAAGRTVGTHGAGPFWQLADGSRVVANVTARADAPAAGAIPWLLLAAQPAGDRPAPRGQLAGVTHIQRVNTAGGTAPSGVCQPSAPPLRVPYRADYHFYKSQA